MLTVLRYLLLIVTAMLDHFCPEFVYPIASGATQGTEVAAVSIYRPLNEGQKRANCESQQAPLASVLDTDGTYSAKRCTAN
jgi:hypothetical protein